MSTRPPATPGWAFKTVPLPERKGAKPSLQHGAHSTLGLENSPRGAWMDLVVSGSRLFWWSIAVVSNAPDYLQSPAAHRSFGFSSLRWLSWCSPAAVGMESLLAQAPRACALEWVNDFTNTHLQTLLLCFGKSTQLHRIRPIKHEASWGSISSAWRVLHHSELWLLQPHTSNLFHFSVQSQ